MIAGRKLELQKAKRAVKWGADPDTNQQIVLETVEELHLFMEPGGYCQHSDGVWVVQPPPPNSPVFHLRSDRRKVEKHQDGTITVTGLPFPTPLGDFKLVKGNWYEVAPEVAPEAKPEGT